MSRRSWLLATLALLLIATFAFGWRRAARAGPSHRELRALRDQRDGAVERVRGLIANRARLAPPESLLGQGNVVVGVPVALIQDIVKQAVTGLFGDFSLHLSEIKVHEAKPVRAKLLFGRSKIGSFVLDLNIHELSGRFAAAPPDLDFDHDRIRVKLPVQLASGGGRATVHFVWQGSGVAGRVCGDLDETREAHGTVVPEEFLLEGAFGVVFEGGKLRLRPQFDELAIRIHVEPSEADWAWVRKVIERKKGVCGLVLDHVDVIAVLKEELANGIRVKLPREIHEVRTIPGGFAESFDVQGHEVAVQIKPAEISITPEMLWYGAAVTVGAP